MLKIFFVLSCLTVVPYQIATAQCINRQPTCNHINEAIVETPRNMVTQPITTTFTSQNTILETPCNVCNSVHQIPTTNFFPSPTTIITDYSPCNSVHQIPTTNFLASPTTTITDYSPCNSVHQIPMTNFFPSPTTIITDYSPCNSVHQIPTTNFLASPTTTITDYSPCNSVHQIPTTNFLPTPTTIITDYSPAMCKNLADTLQLMVVCNLLQNTKGTSDLALQLSPPILNEVLSSPSFSCGCANPLYLNTISPDLISSPIFSPNVIPSSGYISMVPSNPIGNACNNGLFTNVFRFNE